MQRQTIKGSRSHNVLSFNPNQAKMGERLYITIPALDASHSIIPGTTFLCYTLKCSNTKSWILNNAGRLFLEGLQIKIGKDIIYDCVAQNIWDLYADLWKSSEERSTLMGQGISGVNFRKCLSGSDDASSSNTTGGKKDAELAVLLKRQRIPLGQVLDDHGLHSPRGLGVDVKYRITLPSTSAEIGDKQNSQTVGNFSLENIELEYDTIQNQALVESARDEMSQGKSYIIKHVSMENTSVWNKDLTIVNENLHISRQSLKALVYLFKYHDDNLTENFIDPGITEVSVSVNGRPNMVHLNSLKPDSIEREARRYFEKNKEISTGKFFSSQYAVVIDFRPFNEDMRFNDGIAVDGTSGIQTTFKRTATTKDVRSYCFVVADSICQLDQSGFQKTIL